MHNNVAIVNNKYFIVLKFVKKVDLKCHYKKKSDTYLKR